MRVTRRITSSLDLMPPDGASSTPRVFNNWCGSIRGIVGMSVGAAVYHIASFCNRDREWLAALLVRTFTEIGHCGSIQIAMTTNGVVGRADGEDG